MRNLILIIALFCIANFGFSKEIQVNTLKLGKTGSAIDKIFQFAQDADANKGCFKFNETSNTVQLSHDCSSYVDFADLTTAQTLTTKTIDADNNTISNLAHGAEVDNPTSGVHGVIGSVLGTSDAQVVTLKDIDGGTATNTSRVTIPKETTTNLDALTDKEGTIAYDTTLNAVVVNDGASWTEVGPAVSRNESQATLDNVGIDGTVAASALTIKLTVKDGSTDPSGGDPVTIGYRSSTIGLGGFTEVSTSSALSIIVPSGATLGSISGEEHKHYIYAINNAGATELAISSVIRDEGKLHSTVALAASSDLPHILYSTTARTDISLRLLGFVISTQATAGTWATTPSTIFAGYVADRTQTMYVHVNATTSHTGTVGASTSYKTRTLDHLSGDRIGTIATNQLTLGVGEYSFAVPAGGTDADWTHLLIRQDVTGTPTTLQEIKFIVFSLATSGYALSTVRGKFTLTATDVLDFQTSNVGTSGQEYIGTIEITKLK